MMLFSDEEIRVLYYTSQVLPQESDELRREEKYQSFLSRFRSIISAFGCEDEACALFGGHQKYRPTELPFIAFFCAVRHHFASYPVRSHFIPGAFSEWETSFCESMAALFGSIALPELENIAGKSTGPTQEWMDLIALPRVVDGSHFRAMAMKYPIFARQIINFVSLQISHLEEVMDALQNELEPAWNTFFGSRPIPRILSVSGSASDRHNGGKCVHLITFEDGSRIVYKPHRATINKAFRSWLNWLSDAAGERPFLLPRSVETRSGSFCEFISAIPLDTPEEAAIYFRRAGFLMGAVYLLRGNDLHAENIIAHGKEPVIIDLETMIAPEGCLLHRLSGGKNIYHVNSMTLLPSMLSLPGLRQTPFAGFCDLLSGASNLPILNGTPVSGSRYIKEIVEGFDLATRTFLTRREEAGTLLIQAFSGCKVRMVIRPTYVYVRILTGLSGKLPQQDPATYKALISKKHFEENDQLSGKECLRLLQEEDEALDRLDIPFFEEALDHSMLKRMKRWWERMDAALLEEEKARIRFSLTGIKPDAGADITGKTITRETRRPEEHLQTLSVSLMKLFDLTGHCAAIAREQRQYLLSDIPISSPSILEGGLGTLIALASYRKITNGTPELDATISKAIRKLTDPVESASALTARELGFADGGAGYITGCRMLYEMAFLTEVQFQKVLESIGEIANHELLLRYGESNPLYGNNGMLYALSQIPEKFRTRRLLSLHDLILDNILSKQTYKGWSEEELIAEVKAELLHVPVYGKKLTKDDLLPVGNNSLRFGNGAKLYLAAESLSQKDDPLLRKGADELCRYLSVQRHIIPECGIPDSCTESGLLHGMPGVMYSICRYLRPDLIPSL